MTAGNGAAERLGRRSLAPLTRLAMGRRLLAALLLAVLFAVAGNTGSAESRVRTVGVAQVERALRTARPGDVIRLRSGTYGGRLALERSGEAGRPIIVTSAPRATAVITGRWFVTGDHTIIMGLVFEGGTPSNPNDSLLFLHGANFTTIAHNEFRNSAMTAIGVWEVPSNNVTIRRNWIHHVGWQAGGNATGESDAHDHGIYYAQGSNGVIEENRVELISGNGIQAYPNPQSLAIRRNEVGFTGLCGRDGIVVGSDDQGTGGGRLPLASDVVVEGNFVHDVDVYGLRTHWQDELNGPFGTGNLFIANWAQRAGSGVFGEGPPLGQSFGSSGAVWVANVEGAPASGVLVGWRAVGPDGVHVGLGAGGQPAAPPPAVLEGLRQACLR
jgi:hypothetical protein